MKTKADAQQFLESIGLPKFKGYWEPETDHFCLYTRKPVEIVDGVMKGSAIDLFDSKTFRVWTPKTKKAHKVALQYGIRYLKYDGECYIFVPFNVAMDVLPQFGAKVRHTRTPKQMAANALNLLKNARPNAVPGTLERKMGTSA